MPQNFTVQHTRRLVLFLLFVTAAVTAGAWLVSVRRKSQTQQPPPVAPNTTRSAGFSMSKSDQGRTIFTVKASHAREQRDTGKSILENVEIVTYGTQGDRFDRISSKLCEYDATAGRIYSEGDVEIELGGLPGESAAADAARNALPGKPQKPIFVKTSGLTFDEKSGIASTDRLLEFRFERGNGKATGARYDSRHSSLDLNSAVEIFVNDAPGKAPQAPVEIRAASLAYQQRDRIMNLVQPRLRRPLATGGHRELSADKAGLILTEANQINTAELLGNVVASETTPRGSTRLTSARLNLGFNAEQQLDWAKALENVHLDSRTEGSRNDVRAASLEMVFAGPEKELSQVLWKGSVNMVLTPTGANTTAPTRVLTSEVVELAMKPGGSDIETARTLAPGRLELIPAAAPARPAQQPAGAAPRSRDGRRVLTADTLWMQFAADNKITALSADKRVRVVSEIIPAPGAPPAAKPRATQRVTTSDQLAATFTPDTQQLKTLEQNGSFRYVEGPQEATAERAHYTAADERVVLTGKPGRNPEVWDASTRTTAVKITLDQKTNDGFAEEQVRSVHLPQKTEKKGDAGSTPGPLSDKEPVLVSAERMESNSKTGVTRYEGGSGGNRVRLWQNRDVIQARTLVIERETRRLVAENEVTTVLTETQSGEAAKGGTQQPRQPQQTQQRPATVPVTITAGSLVYTDSDRRAHYEKTVVLRRPDAAGNLTTISSASLDAFLIDPDEAKPGQSRLERAVARGTVQITESGAAKRRRAAAELAEYTASDERVVLSGGKPYVYEEQRGYTRGEQLTYHLRDDTIFVHGNRGSRTVTESRIQRH